LTSRRKHPTLALDKISSQSSVEEWLSLDRDDFVSKWYRERYAANSYSGAAGLVQKQMHMSLERGYNGSSFFQDVLELGGNVGEHLAYVKHGFGEYVLTDRFDCLGNTEKQNLEKRGIRFQAENAETLSFAEGSFDRVLNTCLLHHLKDPEAALLEVRRVLRPGGVADIFLASDPGLAFRFGRWIGPRLNAKMQGAEAIKTLMDARDHINHAGGLLRLIQHVFRLDIVQKRSYPIRGMTWNSSLWQTFRVTRSCGK
jgi:SAM-dependent methyltransferase